jgi:amino-acid N-acetyltransferase
MAVGPIPVPDLIERRAELRDVPAMAALIGHWAERREMLPRSETDLCRTIRDFWIVEEEGRVLGCCGLRIFSQDLAEVCSLAIAPEEQGRGLGRVLVQLCLAEARDKAISRVFALTYQVGFFERVGFAVTPMDALPDKVWRDCVNCPFLDNCNETAVIIVPS